MMTPRIQLITLAAALCGVWAAIAWTQRRAASCPRHRRWVGTAASLLGWACLAGAVALLVLAAIW